MTMRGDVIVAIQHLTAEKGYPPTVRELRDQLGVSSTSTVHKYLCQLVDAGLVLYDEGKTRTIRLVQ